MKKGEKYFVRVDKKIDGKTTTKQDFDSHIKYLSKIAKQRTFLGGGFANEPGGMIIYSADSFEQAKIIAQQDPLIKKGLYEFKLHEWDILLES